MKYCTNCGSEIPPGAQVCTGCGRLISASEDTSSKTTLSFIDYSIYASIILTAIGVSLLFAGIILAQSIVEPVIEIDLYPIIFDTTRTSWSLIFLVFSSIISIVNVIATFVDSKSQSTDYRLKAVTILIITILFVINAYNAFQFTL